MGHDSLPADAPWRALYPFRSHELRLSGLRYHYLDERPSRDGSPSQASEPETLLMVHGNPTWSFYWRRLALAWRNRWRVVVPDHLGCGLSDKPADYPYCLDQHAENLLALVRGLDLRRITLLAHDWGGAIGLSAALREPDRFARLVLFNTAAFPGGRMPLRIALCRAPVIGPWLVRGLNGFARAALWMAVERRSRLPADVRAGLIAPYDSWAHRVAIQRFVEDIPLGPEHPSYAALEQLAAGLPSLRSKPALLVWGMRDWCFTPWFLEQFVRVWPHAEVARLDDVGHYVVEEAPERIMPLVERFIATHPAEGMR